jgi:uncharacterized circularly permuted ATP-grasp superfamily protein/uncharacterized alpha-E superfamily protein
MSEVRIEPNAAEAASLVEGYRLAADAPDEMCDLAAGVRPHWQHLMGALSGLGGAELKRRRDEAWRLIRDNDVTFNIYDDPRGMGRPWELDLIPQLIGSDEWREIEVGLAQRAELLNLLLRDLYGPRKLISRGVLPPELVYAHPGFLHPCVGIPLPASRALMFYAADLARTGNGEVCVLADRAQAPSGTGYALENRVVISRVLPSLFRDSHVHRLATFFRSVRHALSGLSPRPGEEPNVVLLTPGPANEAYFEHSYLANYLGYTLVQGGDLTVRDGRVWLTTLEGLRPVDVILRRMDDSFCDPVELREDSYLGVPGLTQAVRAQQVGIANPLGTGVLESPALLSFLPALARHLLGEDLRLPSVTTWWCGHRDDCKHVLAHLDRLVIKPVHPSIGFRFIFGAELSVAERRRLAERIRARPQLFVGQEPLSMSTVPVLTDTGLEPRRTVMRSFLVADEQDYFAMPGGLTRVSAHTDKLVVSNQAGGVSKDTWVLATEPEKQVSLFFEGVQARQALGQGSEVPGRVADNLFWLGRYAERAESNSRLLRLTLQFLITGGEESSACMQRLLGAVTAQTSTFPGFLGQGAEERLRAPQQELHSIIAEPGRAGTLAQTLSALLLAARSVRDRLSTDTWRVINDVDQELHSLQRISPDQLVDALDELDNLVNALTALAGLTMENMTRGRSWRFLDIGRRLERAVQTVRLLCSTLIPVTDPDQESLLGESLLAVVDSLMSYRRRYRHGMQIPNLLELVLYDERNPRSLAYQVSRIEEHVADLPREQDPGYRTDLERLALEAATLVRLADVNLLATAAEESGRREHLEALLNQLSNRLPALSDALTASYFRVAAPPHQLVQLRGRRTP